MVQLNDYIIEDRSDAELVLQLFLEIAENYGNVTIADYYDLIGVIPHYRDSLFGWRSESLVDIVIAKVMVAASPGYREEIAVVNEGYIIKLPPVVQLI